jgi:hypothetical protein
MWYVFLTSLSLLVCSFVFRVIEESHGLHAFHKTRAGLNARFVRMSRATSDFLHAGCEYTHRELFARVLHMGIYGTLFFTRKLERGLENSMVWLRSLRRTSRARRIVRQKRRNEERSVVSKE